MHPHNYFWNYLPLLIQLIVVVGMGSSMVTTSWFIGRHRNTKVKLAAYECGIPVLGDARGRFSVRFYMVAMLFILFDVEAVFILPWAVIYRRLPSLGRGPLFRILGDDCLPRLRRRRPLLHLQKGYPRLVFRQGGPLIYGRPKQRSRTR